jgi:hypothetical protein|tara:strand:+ start:2461 stop:2730 length:270 start_codon:yes stop_codon:yes gene_type:complete
MKFKVLESNDYTYDSKDKNIYTSWDLYKIKNRVKENPNRMTFNPVESYFQDLYYSWDRDKKDAIIFASFMSSMATLMIVAILALMLGVS